MSDTNNPAGEPKVIVLRDSRGRFCRVCYRKLLDSEADFMCSDCSTKGQA